MKKLFRAFALLSLLLALAPGWAQEEKDLPSQKTKEAVDKFKKAPGSVGKGLEALKEAGKAKLKDAMGGEKAPAAKAAADPLPAKKPAEPEPPRYSGTGKRDPFRPLPLKSRPTPRPRENLSPLERYELGQLKLVGIVWDIKNPKAMVEDAAGLGFIVTVGTPIGTNEGKIKEIKPAEVVIQENYIDFYGARKTQETSMKLPVE